MAMVTVEMDMSKPMELTPEQLRELEEAEASPVCPDEDCPEMTDEQLKILSLVLSHPGTRGGGRRATYFQGMETERVSSLRNLMDTMHLTLRQAMAALKLPETEYEKYAAVITEPNENANNGFVKYANPMSFENAAWAEATEKYGQARQG